MSDKDTKDILKKATDLVNGAELDSKDVSLEVDDEIVEDEDNKPLVETEAEEVVKPKQEGEDPHVFKLKKMGYRRMTHYKKPRLWMFVALFVIILILIFLAGMQMPYIPPIL